MQNIGNALFAGSGGFFIGHTGGSGQVVVGGFGSLFLIDVAAGKDIVVDNGHVVAWDSALHYEIAVSTSRSQGLFGNLISSATSGEGVVLRFSGSGKVLLCSRNRDNLLAWISHKLKLSS